MQSCPFGSGGKGLVKANPKTLRVALGDSVCLIALNSAISIALDLEDSAAANCLTTRRELDNLPGVILHVGLHLLHSGLTP